MSGELCFVPRDALKAALGALERAQALADTQEELVHRLRWARSYLQWGLKANQPQATQAVIDSITETLSELGLDVGARITGPGLIGGCSVCGELRCVCALSEHKHG